MLNVFDEQSTSGGLFSGWKFLRTAECELEETVIDAVYLSSRIAPLLARSGTRASSREIMQKKKDLSNNMWEHRDGDTRAREAPDDSLRYYRDNDGKSRI